jgi:hypothetical protein
MPAAMAALAWRSWADEEGAFALGIGEAKGVVAVGCLDEMAGGVGAGFRLESAGGAQQIDPAGFGEEVDVGRAADTDRRVGRGGIDDVKPGPQRRAAEADMGNCAIPGADAGGEACAFEGRSGGGCTTEECVAGLEDDFAVGADIDQEAWAGVVEQP